MPTLSLCLSLSLYFYFSISISPGVTVAAKGYFDALVKLGELASDSQGSKELGKTLQIQTVKIPERFE